MRTILPARAAGLLIVAASILVGSCDQRTVTAGLEPEPLGPPVMALSKSSADFNAVTHSLVPVQVIAISNAGPGVLGGLGIGSVEYFGEASGWLTASLSGTSAPTTLMLQAAAGSGLGLAIARWIAERVGGRLRYEAPPDGGAVFVMELRVRR